MRRVGVLYPYPETDQEALAHVAAFREGTRSLRWKFGRIARKRPVASSSSRKLLDAVATVSRFDAALRQFSAQHDPLALPTSPTAEFFLVAGATNLN